MAGKLVEKNVIYVGEGDQYARDFRNGENVILKKGIVTPVSDELFLILKDAPNVHVVKGHRYDVPKKDFKEDLIRE